MTEFFGGKGRGEGQILALPFSEIWLLDTEFSQPEGERPKPICLVALEVRSGKEIRLWLEDKSTPVPFRTDADALFVAYYAAAEVSVFLAMDWPVPTRVLDLFTEFRNITNGILKGKGSATLLGALTYFGLDGSGAHHKEVMRDRCIQGAPFTAQERQEILDYCAGDVHALARLLPDVLLRMRRPYTHAMVRGRAMVATAKMERVGVPIDVDRLHYLDARWELIKAGLVAQVNPTFGVFEGLSFRQKRFDKWLGAHGIEWLRHDSGSLDLSDINFRLMCEVHPEIEPLREVRHSLSMMRLTDITVGADGFNRTMLSAFRARSGRYQPSNAKFVFGPSKYLRFLIKPPEGMGIGYIDYEQQEFAIAAVKGNDSQMWDDYDTGDPYMALAIRAGGAPRGATKVTHPRERALYKTCALALNYGMGARSLAFRIKQQVVYARELIQANHRVYPDFWRYSDNVVDNAMGYGYLDTGLGWRMHVTEEDHKTPALRNFPMQATGAEMIRLACCLATERGIQVCCPVHDALLVMAPVEVLDEAIHNTRTAMAEASKIILGGYEIRTEVDKRVVYPNRFTDERGRDMWELVNRLSTQFGSRHDN